MDPPVADPIAAAVEAARAELLDPGLHNPLIRARVGRARGVEVTDERTREVYRIVVHEGHAMDFLPTEDAPPDPTDLGQPLDDVRWQQRHVDRHLQTTYTSPTLQRRLLHTARAARSLIEERGYNALALALGALRWAHAGTELCSPLLLVPATLDRTNARCRFVVRHSGEDIGANLSLAAMLKADHGFELPEPPDAPDPAALDAWFDALDAAVAGRPGWRIDRDVITLDLFDAKRFLLYRDLDPASWPADHAPHQHRIIRALLGEGFGALPQMLASSAKPPTLEVVAADTSQTEALSLVAAGCDVVIEGPPGTGKSQTITHLIAGAVARGERVLFVADKMAALDVVHRRLVRVGLGAACLELHSHKSRKRDVLDALRRTLDLGAPHLSPDAETDRAALAAVTARLAAHDAAMTIPVEPFGLSPVDAIGRWDAIDAAGELPPLPFAPMADWDRATLATHRERVAELQARVAALGMPAEHPFFGCTRTALGPTDAEQLGVELETAAARAVSSEIAHAALAAELGLPPPDGMLSSKAMRAIGRALADAPDLDGMERADPRWHDERSALEDALDLVDAINREVAANPEVLEEAWPEDLLVAAETLVEARGALKDLGEKWWRWFSGRWRRAKATAALVSRDDLGDDPRAWRNRINAIIRVRRHRRDLAGLAPLAAALYKARWRDRHLDAELIRRALYWLAEAHRWIADGTWPDGVRARLARPWDRARLRRLATAAEAAEQRRVEALATITDALGWAGLALDELPTATLGVMLDRWRLNLDRFAPLCRYNRLAALARDEGLDSIVELAEHWDDAGTRLVDALDANWVRGVLETARAQRSAFADFDRIRHLHAVERFAALDRARLGHDRAAAASAHHTRIPRDGDAMAVLRREMEKKARHLPLRQLLLDAGEVIQRIKPVMLMSPMSVAAYLAPEGPRFDLVVFDEASQVRPVDALGALARARRAVVVGDSKQLPPTRFFERQLDSGDLIDGEHNVTADLESVLGLFVAAGAPSRMLRWHYRSRHPSLVAVSNHLFYGDALTLFPSPVRDPATTPDLGLALRHLPHAIYDRGGTRTNAAEADAIADAVVEHAQHRPELTLGVVAFSAAQMDAIADAIERRRRIAVDAEAFFAAHIHEPFFVKNLENVQGDERDVILLSVGYGRDRDRRVPTNFGPLGLTGGERRLNVAITRARRRLVVFTNLEPEDIEPTSAGVTALRTFLAYARDGHLSMAPPRGRADAPFEDALAAALEARGHTIHRRVGDAGCAVALAVVDPEDPDRYLLGVDCDGLATADGTRLRVRDAIRLRPSVLRGLGWHLHRVWAAAWHQDPAGALNRLEAALAEARDDAPAPDDDGPIATPTRAPGAVTRVEVDHLPFAAYDRWTGALTLPFVDLSPAAADALIIEIAHHEAPLALSTLARRIVEAGGAHRTSKRLAERIDRITGRLTDGGVLRRDGRHVYLPGAKTPPPRTRRGLTRGERHPCNTPPPELEAALADTLAAARTLSEDELIQTTGVRLGMVSSELERSWGRGPFESAIGALVADGRARRHGIDLIWEESE